MDTIPRGDFYPSSRYIHRKRGALPKARNLHFWQTQDWNRHPLQESIDHPLASLYHTGFCVNRNQSQERLVCSHLAGSLTSRNRGGYTSALWIMNGSYLALGTKSPELALFSRSSMTYCDSKALTDLDTEVVTMENARSRRFFMVGDAVGSVQFCSSNTEKLGSINVMTGTGITSISPNIGDTKISVAGAHGSHVSLIDVGSLRVESTLQVKGYEPYIARWHSAWSLLATGSRSQHINLHDPRTSLPHHQWIGHRASISTLGWLPGKEFYLLTGGREGVCRIWDIRNLPSSFSSSADLMSMTVDEPGSSIKPIESLNDTEQCVAGFLVGNRKQDGVLKSDDGIYATVMATHPTLQDALTLGDSRGNITHWDMNRLLKGSCTSSSVEENFVPTIAIQGAHTYSVTTLTYDKKGEILVTTGSDTAARIFSPAPPGVKYSENCDITNDLVADDMLNSISAGEQDAKEGLGYKKMPLKCIWS